MARVMSFIMLALIIASCGKNDNFRTTGNFRPTTPYSPPPTTNPYGDPPPVQWQVPSNQPPQFQPFAPMYNYMQQEQQTAMYWQYMWSQWSQYAQQQQVYVYDFDVFWNDFCPQAWQSQPQYQEVYQWFDYNVYYAY